MWIKKGDTVLVSRGKDRGKQGKVLFVLPEAKKVVVEGVNFVTKHVKPSAATSQGSIEKREAAMPIERLKLIDPESGKPTRIRHRIVEGKKVRVAVKSDKVMD
ncbi:MAG: 50S ribosomal protein L24 [Deinococcaceae bacterium]